MVQFLTSRQVSHDDVVQINPGTAVSAFSSSQQAAKNRQWHLVAAAGAANLPQNPYRASVIIDNTLSTQDAFVVFTADTNPATTSRAVIVKSGTRQVLNRADSTVGTEEIAVVMGGTTVTACEVTELSFV